MPALSKAAGRSRRIAAAGVRRFRSQAAPSSFFAGGIRRFWRITRRDRRIVGRLGWLVLALPLILVIVADSIGTPTTPADAAPSTPPAVLAGPGSAPNGDGSNVAQAADASAVQAVAPQRGGPALAPLDAAEQARRAGDYDRALTILREQANAQDRNTANEALLQHAVVQIDAGRYAAATESAGELMGRQIDAPVRARALFVLGRAKRASEDYLGALAAFDEVVKTAPDFGPYADLQAAYCLAALNDRPGQNARAGKALELAQARLTKVDALEHQVTATLKQGNTDAALKASDALLTQATTRTYRAQTLTSLGVIARDAERRDLAIKSFATVIAELPDTPSAIGAFDALQSMNALTAVAPDEAPAVLFFAARYGEAVPGLRAAIDSGLIPEKKARARFYLGQALLRLGSVDEGVSTLKLVADDLPGSDLAARAALRAGRRLEADRRLKDASDLYDLAAKALPASAASQEAQSQLVYTLMMRGAAPEALQAAIALAGGEADGRWKGLALLWASKGLTKAGDRAQATALLARAAEIDTDGFGGLRARAILDGDTRGGQGSPDLDLAVLQPTPDDLAGLNGWLAGGGIDLAALEREQGSEPGYQRAALLYRVGMPEWAAWELQELAARWEADPGRLYGLARFASERGDTPISMRFALAAQKATGAAVAAQPRLLQRLIYPLPYADLIAAQGKQRGVDPLLFAGLIRQESTFNPRARSSANALGLAQVVPSTGQGIASALGRPSFSNDDLYRPAVAVEFGVFYLARQLGTYDGRVYPALAAYNAGGGNVNGWVAEFGNEDPDIFMEMIPFAETSYYVRIVYENYQQYRRLYR
ncbi:MAG: transglycosylase SLT domain-containing protein [Chloroflexi bacterium]|nr:transglycosylase SLT domain-containing protein [Chloroflexota bacterium]